jgi:CRP/FNR family cyclic AMP-dependent transcriptional regulator
MEDMPHRPFDALGAKDLADVLPPAALVAVKAIQTKRIYPEGYEFFAQGEPSSGIYILYAGQVQLSIVDSDGGKLVLGFALPGDILGLTAALSGKSHEERAEATIACQAGFINFKDFLHFLDHHPEAAFWIVQLLSNRVAVAFEHLSSVRGVPCRRVTQ